MTGKLIIAIILLLSSVRKPGECRLNRWRPNFAGNMHLRMRYPEPAGIQSDILCPLTNIAVLTVFSRWWIEYRSQIPVNAAWCRPKGLDVLRKIATSVALLPRQRGIDRTGCQARSAGGPGLAGADWYRAGNRRSRNILAGRTLRAC